MRAIRVEEFGGPEVMRLGEVPDPQPGPGQVLLTVKAAGVNPVDTYIRAALQGYGAPLPYTPGTDAAGTIAALGSGVSGVRVGDRVYTAGTLTGSYAELALCDASQVHRLPERATFAQGAALGIPFATAYRALFQRAALEPGETVLVHGASGGVGTAAVQLARAAGATVFGSAGSPAGLRLVLEQGAHHALDHTDPDYLAQIQSLTQGRGVDVILEMMAHVNLVKDLGMLARYGRVVVIGSRGSIEFEPRLTMRIDASILGMALFNTPPPALARIHAALGAGLENGTLRPLVRREFPLPDAPRAHEAVMDPQSAGKIVLLP